MLGCRNVDDGRHWDGQHAVGAADGAGALIEDRQDDFLDAQVVQANSSGGDIHDGIHRADLVKMHGL